MPTPQDAQAKAAGTYNATADYYDHPANAFWDRYGRRTIERLSLGPGARVLDVCCGSGASAIHAAERVGPRGSVLGIDLADNLLTLARKKAQDRGLTNVDFRLGDMLNLGLPASEFDAVVCVFGIFFVPDISEAVSKLWTLVQPGGKVAITTWGPRFLEPANTAFWESIRDVRPDLYKGFNPWDRITDPTSLKSVLAEGGVVADDVVAQFGTQKITSPEDWWAMVMGTGYRGTIEQLSQADRDYAQQANFSYIRREGITEVETNVVFAVATKP